VSPSKKKNKNESKNRNEKENESWRSAWILAPVRGAKAYVWLMAYWPHPQPLSRGEGSTAGVAESGITTASKKPLSVPEIA
jgi:hypothetical protein